MSAPLHAPSFADLAGRQSAIAPVPVTARLARMLSAWDMRRNTRIALRKLDAHGLADIGIEPGIALLEAQRPFWKA